MGCLSDRQGSEVMTLPILWFQAAQPWAGVVAYFAAWSVLLIVIIDGYVRQ